jgi:hypothetical protein
VSRRDSHFAHARASPGRFLLSRQIEGAVDEGDVGERLREIADEPARLRIVLLAEQADIVAQSNQAIEQFDGFVHSIIQDVLISP